MLLCGLTPAVAAPEEPMVVDLKVELRDGAWFASFDLEDGFSERILDRIASGLPVTFRAFVEVRRKGVIRTKLGEQVIDVTADLDSLTKQYRLSRELDGHVIGSSATEKEEEMRRWMTETRDLDLGPPPAGCDTDAPFVRVKIRVESGFKLVFFPYHKETAWSRVDLPCPGEEPEEGSDED